jgi:hypothetical protein
MKALTRNYSLILSLLVISSIGASSASASPVELRLHGGLGAWTGSFEQSDAAGHEVDIRTLTSLGLEFAAGLGIGIVFVEYNFAWMIANHTLSFSMDPNAVNNPSDREGPYFAPLGLNAGVSIPFIPIEPYLGIERGTFGFSSGAQAGYSGITG